MFLLWFPGINQIISKNQTQDKHPVNFSRKNKEKTMLRDTKNIFQVKNQVNAVFSKNSSYISQG